MREGSAPTVPLVEFKTIRAALRLELGLLLAMVLCAALMARGIGF
jgi:uncharacterized membrane protein